jgi:hypothetical protein
MRACLIICLALFLVGAGGGNLRAQDTKQLSLALVDTVERDAWLYKPLTDILRSVGFNVTYKSLHSVLDQSLQRLALPRYDAVFFLLGNEFLSGLSKSSHVCTKVLQALELASRQPGRVVGLIFPSLRLGPNANIVGACAPIFDRLGIKTSTQFLSFPKPQSFDAGMTDIKTQQQSIDSFLYMTNVFLGVPIESRPMPYHTTLNMPHGGLSFDVEQIEGAISAINQPLFLLPMKNDCSAAVKQGLPYGLYWFNPVRKNHVLVTTSSLLTFSSISENFHVCPTDFTLRHEMLSLVQRMMFEVSLLARARDPKELLHAAPLLETVATPHLPSSIVSLGFKNINMSISARKMAWMEINVFDEQSIPATADVDNAEKIEQLKKQQDQLIDYIYESGLDSLWITFNPQMYYSPIGRLINQEQRFLKSVSTFTKKLKDGAEKYKASVPHVLVGYEITNNIYEPHLPKKYPVDLYQHAYQDLPIPIDKSFWRSEITAPLETFVKKWAQPDISHGVPLAGVVLDLEMYCRKKTGSFTTPMGFDAATFYKFARMMRLPWKSVPLRDRPLSLMNSRLAGNYFRYLEKEAETIGIDMQQHFTRLIPDCLIMCYLPQVSISWFYKGLYKGLSHGNRPLQLLTFNSEFFAHEEWFSNNRIPATHSSVLLLSKVREQNDFEWIDYVLTHHHGVWLNRFSRFVEPKSTGWTNIEQPGLNESQYSSFLEYIKSK